MKKYQIGNLTIDANSPVEALKIAKIISKAKDSNNVANSVKDTYKRQYIIGFSNNNHTFEQAENVFASESQAQNEAKQIAKRLGFKYYEVICADIDYDKNDDETGNQKYIWVKAYETATDKRLNDSDIDELTEEEKKAVADYKAAIANTKDPKLLKLFAHILKEEVEHLEELKNKDIEK